MLLYISYCLVAVWSHMLVMTSRHCTRWLSCLIGTCRVIAYHCAMVVVECAAAGCRCDRWTWFASRWSTSRVAVSRLVLSARYASSRSSANCIAVSCVPSSHVMCHVHRLEVDGSCWRTDVTSEWSCLLSDSVVTSTVYPVKQSAVETDRSSSMRRPLSCLSPRDAYLDLSLSMDPSAASFALVNILRGMADFSTAAVI